MKKMKLLVIGMSLEVGGAEKSLVNMLNMIDYKKYDVDLLLFQRKGPFLNQIPSQVEIISINEIEVLFQSIKQTIKSKRFNIKNIKLGLQRYLITAYEKIRWKQFDRIRIHRWKDLYHKLIPNNNKKYDVGIAYAGGETAYYLVDKVECKRKVYFFHSDYSKIDIDIGMEKEYVESVNSIITISDICKDSLIKLFPTCKSKIKVLQNLSSPALIKKLSLEFVPEEYKTNLTKIVSIGRLHEIKGYDMAIEAANILRKLGVEFKWYIVGEGIEREKLEDLIEKYSLKENFILLGMKENPYPYIYNANILVQPSRFEGKSVVLDEAKIINIPIIATNYNSVEDQIINEKTGLIVDMNSQSIAKGIERMINDYKLVKRIKENLTKEDFNSLFDVNYYMETICKED